MSNSQNQNHFPGIDPATQDEMDRIKAAADSLRSIGGLAIIPPLEAEILSAKERAMASYLAVQDFAQTLPKQLPWSTRVDGQARTRNPRFESTDLQELRALESTVWWVDAHKIPRPRHIESHIKPIIPMYVVGERKLDKKTESDSAVSLLLADVGHESATYYTTTVSTVEKERADALTTRELLKPLTPREVQSRYHEHKKRPDEGPTGTAYGLEPVATHAIDDPLIGGARLHRVPKDSTEREVFYANLDSRIAKKGIRGGQIMHVAFSADMVGDYNMPLHCFKIAAMLNKEAEFAAMQSRLAELKL